MSVDLGDEASLYGLATWTNGAAFRNEDFAAAGDPVIKIAELKSGFTDSTKRTQRELAPGQRAEPGDLLFAWSGNPESSIDAFIYDGEPGWLNQHIFKVVAVPHVDQDFLYYLLKFNKPALVELARNRQTTGLGHVTVSDMKRLMVRLPGRPQQVEIAEALTLADSAIAAARRRRATLKHMQNTLLAYAREFDTTDVLLDELAVYHNKRRVPLSAKERAQRPGTIPYYGATGVVDTVDEHLFDGAHVLLGEDGSVVRADGTPFCQYVWGRFWVNNHAHVLTGTAISTELLHLMLTRSQVGHLVTGAVQAKISMSNLRRLMLSVPSPDDLARLEKQVALLYEGDCQAARHMEVLTAARDALMLGLFTGDVDLSTTAAELAPA